MVTFHRIVNHPSTDYDHSCLTSVINPELATNNLKTSLIFTGVTAMAEVKLAIRTLYPMCVPVGLRLTVKEAGV